MSHIFQYSAEVTWVNKIAYDCQISCQNYFRAGRNVYFLPGREVRQEGDFALALRIATWMTGVIPLLVIIAWSISHRFAQPATQERLNYWGNLDGTPPNWEIPEGEEHLYALRSEVSGYWRSLPVVRWLADTGIPSTPFEYFVHVVYWSSLTSRADGRFGCPPPQSVAERMLIVGTRVGACHRGDLGCRTPQDAFALKPEEQIPDTELMRIRATHTQGMDFYNRIGLPKPLPLEFVQAVYAGHFDPDRPFQYIER